jgi:Peptidase propeptide and YPEB domain
MKINIQPFVGSILIATSLALVSGCATHKSQSALEAQAKITKAQAQEIALAKVPNGTIKDAELEKENGKLQWSFDVATPDSKDITEVNVDALTGEVISAAKESAASEAREATQENDKDKD